jgi:hypothetical protein
MTALDIAETLQLAIFPNDGHYVFKRTDVDGKIESVNLTPSDILKLYQEIPQFARLVMQSEQPRIAGVPGLGSEVWAAVRRTAIVVDTHSTVVLLRVEDEFGLESRFLLDDDLSRRTGQDLVRRADEIRVAASSRHRQ